MGIRCTCIVGSSRMAGDWCFAGKTACQQPADFRAMCSTRLSCGVFCSSVFGSLFLAWTCIVSIDRRGECSDNNSLPAHYLHGMLFGRAAKKTTKRLLVYPASISCRDSMLYAALDCRRIGANPYADMCIGYGILRT